MKPAARASLAARLSVALVLLSGLLLAAGPAAAQAGGPQWTALTPGAPAGTPADVLYDAAQSGLGDSFFDVFIHGFWTETRVGDDANTYTRIIVPGLDPSVSVTGHGAPELPTVRGLIGLGTDASAVVLASATTLDSRTLVGFGLVWPDIIPARDHPEGNPPIFVRDETIYGSTTPWPAGDGVLSASVVPVMAGIKGAMFEAYPFKWNPATGDLTIAAQSRLHFTHAGNPVVTAPITRERGRLASQVFLNWPGVKPQFPLNTINYTANFLFIYPPGYRDALLPLINQKKARGFAVSERTTDVTGHTCTSIRQAIFDWYDTTPQEHDKYLLLVGDTNEIPLCTSPPLPDDSLGVATDDLYGTSAQGEIPQVLNLVKEIHHGRLAVDSEADCAQQVAKILAYEDHPGFAPTHYDDVLLVAHKEEAPGKYVGAQEVVRTAAYAIPPTFHTRYGNSLQGTTAGVLADIDDGMGLVAYRGHGSSTAWTDWGVMGQDIDTNDILALNNGAKTPIVLSFACTNSNLDSEDSISEQWMEQFPGGAVSAVGSTTASWTTPNHEFDRLWFEAIYDRHLTTITHAMEWAELRLAVFDPEWGTANTWMYLLLGDPDLQIRRRNPDPWQIVAPAMVPACGGGCPPLEIQVMTLGGSPVEDALVAAWKPAAATVSTIVAGEPAGDEVFANRYTGADGHASIPGSAITPGWIIYTVQDDSGNAVCDSIEVIDLTGVGPSTGTLAFTANPSVTHGATQLRFGRSFDVSVRVGIYDVGGRRVRQLEVDPGASGVLWDGTGDSGRPVTSGLYFARFEGAALRAVTRIVMTR